jgi:hypothetical protein
MFLGGLTRGIGVETLNSGAFFLMIDDDSG